MAGEADKDIRIRYTVEADEATQRLIRIREETNKLKATLLDMMKANASGVKELSSLAKSLEKSMATKIMGGKGGLGLVDPEEIKKAQDQIGEMKEAMKLAAKEIRTEQVATGKETSQQAKLRTDAEKSVAEATKTTVKQQIDAIKQKVSIQKQLEKDTASEIKRLNKEQTDAIREYERVTRQGYGVMSAAAQQYGAQVQAVKAQIQQIASQTGVSFQQAGQQLVATGTPIQQVNSALKQLNTQTQASAFGFSNLGSIAKYVFGTIFGITIITALRNVVQWLGRTVESGNDLIKAMFQLEMGIRAIQRSGVEITIQDVYKNIDKLGKRFGIFSKKELVEGSAALINLVRDFGFTKEQIFEMQEAIATLAVVNGRAMDDVQRTVALAISSGYTEGLQRLGVSINRVVIAQKAAALGYADNYMSLTELQRAEATRLLILERTAKYDEDALLRQERIAGATDKARAAWTNYTTAVGEGIARATAGFTYFIATVLGFANEAEGVAKKYNIVTLAIQGMGDAAALVAKFYSELWKVIKGEEDFREALRNFKEFGENWQKGLEDLEPPQTELEKIQEVVSDSLENLEEANKRSQEKREDLQRDYNQDIEKMQRENARRQEENERELQRDLEEIDRDGTQDRIDLQRDFFKKLQDIDKELGRDIAEENSKYATDVAQTIRQFTIRKAELEARYRENEKKAEIRFQEEMRKLREGFLFDLEDALHERDARQILRLIRQYNLQKEQTKRQYDIDREERKRAFKLELEELEIQRQERLRILAEEHAARIAAIQRQAEYERELARQKYEEEKAELERKLEEEKQERIAKFLEQQAELKRRLEEDKAERKILLDQQIQDLAIERDRILQEIGEKLWGALQLTTSQGLATLYKTLKDALGEGGEAEKVLKYYADMAETEIKRSEGAWTRVEAMLANIVKMKKELGIDKAVEVEPTEIPISARIEQEKIAEVRQQVLDIFGEETSVEMAVSTSVDKGKLAEDKQQIFDMFGAETPIELAVSTSVNETEIVESRQQVADTLDVETPIDIPISASIDEEKLAENKQQLLDTLGTGLWDEVQVETNAGLAALDASLSTAFIPDSNIDKSFQNYSNSALKWLGTELWNELQIETEDGLNDLYKALLKTLGRGGDADKVINYYREAMRVAAQDAINSIRAIIAAMSAAFSFASAKVSTSTSSSVNIPTQTTTTPSGGNPRQAGGVTYEGEVYKVHKNETFVPAVDGRILSVQQSQEALANTTSRGSRVDIGGHATINVMLQQGLIADIVDNALGETAEVLISQMRRN